jgi:hypothetical protein
MYKSKLSPEQALETIKLRMKYDSSKTLNENIRVIKEQTTNKLGCVTFPAGQNFVDVRTKSKYSLRLFNNGVIEQISDKEKGTWECATESCQITFKWNKAQSSNVSMSFTETVLGCKNGKIEGQSSNTTSNTNTNTNPSDLTDVKAFQDWLDKNKPGWAAGYTGGIVNKGKGYGTYGPRTKKAWEDVTIRNEFLKASPTTPTPTSTPAKSEEEEAEAVYGDNPSDIIATN